MTNDNDEYDKWNMTACKKKTKRKKNQQVSESTFNRNVQTNVSLPANWHAIKNARSFFGICFCKQNLWPYCVWNVIYLILISCFQRKTAVILNLGMAAITYSTRPAASCLRPGQYSVSPHSLVWYCLINCYQTLTTLTCTILIQVYNWTWTEHYRDWCYERSDWSR